VVRLLEAAAQPKPRQAPARHPRRRLQPHPPRVVADLAAA